MAKTRKEIALEWIKEHIDRSEFKDEDSTEEQLMEWYAIEMERFSSDLDPVHTMQEFIDINYKVDTFFGDHEKVAERYYQLHEQTY